MSSSMKTSVINILLLTVFALNAFGCVYNSQVLNRKTIQTVSAEARYTGLSLKFDNN